MDFSEVEGNAEAIEAAVVSVAAGVSLLLAGSAGSGRTMIARRMVGLFPALSAEQTEQRAALLSAASIGGDPAEVPFRAPHHTCSLYGVEGTKDRPGELALAHGGILFLDEATEFHPTTLEHVRWAARPGIDAFGRPARFPLISAAALCPCGMTGSLRICTCPATTIAQGRPTRASWGEHLQALGVWDMAVLARPLPRTFRRTAPNWQTTAVLRERMAAATAQLGDISSLSVGVRIALARAALRGETPNTDDTAYVNRVVALPKE